MLFNVLIHFANVHVLHNVQTQTEKKLSLFGQFLYCLLANETYRWSTMCIEGTIKADLGQEGAGEGGNADRPLVQLDLEDRQLRQDPLPPHLHPLQRHLLDALFQGPSQSSYHKTDCEIQAAKMFTWENHGVSGNIEH